jgi:hypothetical protein
MELPQFIATAHGCQEISPKRRTGRLLKKSDFTGCSRKLKRKAYEILQSEAYSAIRPNDEGSSPAGSWTKWDRGSLRLHMVPPAQGLHAAPATPSEPSRRAYDQINAPFFPPPSTGLQPARHSHVYPVRTDSAPQEVRQSYRNNFAVAGSSR